MSWSSLASVMMQTALCAVAWRKRSVIYLFIYLVLCKTQELKLQIFGIFSICVLFAYNSSETGKAGAEQATCTGDEKEAERRAQGAFLKSISPQLWHWHLKVYLKDTGTVQCCSVGCSFIQLSLWLQDISGMLWHLKESWMHVKKTPNRILSAWTCITEHCQYLGEFISVEDGIVLNNFILF